MTEAEAGVFFVHLPSCGGTTFWSLLRTVYGRDSTLHFEKTEAVAAFLENEDEARAQCVGVPVVGGHIPYGKARHLFPKRRFITFLRNPVERAISVYSRRVRNGRWAPSIDRGSNDILDFWEQASTTQCVRFFSPSGKLEPGKSIDQVMDVLESEFAVFGMTEHFDQSLFLMQRQLGWPEVPTYDRRNVGGNKPVEIPGEVRERLTEFLADECEIYRQAREIFDKRSEQLKTPEMLREIGDFDSRQEERHQKLLASQEGQLPDVKQEESPEAETSSSTME